MKTALVVALASACVATVLVAAKDAAMMVHVFDSSYAGGVDGTIKAVWEDNINSDIVKIKADLSFKSVDFAALKKADGNCTGPVTEYTWHIHTQWKQPQGYTSWSASYKQCSKDATGNHYDPYKACGPASEYVGTPECASKTAKYKCTPETYRKNWKNCEVGDLSGKVGTFKPNKDGKVKAEWTDLNYGRFGKQQQTWSIVIHAVCGSATPRLACAQSQKMGPQYIKGSKHYGHDHGEDNEADDDDDNGDDDDEGDDDEHGEHDEQGEDDHDEDDEHDEEDDHDHEGGEILEGDQYMQKPHTVKRETIVLKIYTDKDN